MRVVLSPMLVLLLLCCGSEASPETMASSAPAQPGPRVRMLGRQVIAIRFGDSFDPAAGADTASYQLSRRDGQIIEVQALGREAAPSPSQCAPLAVSNTVFLVLPRQLQPGGTYTLTLSPEVSGQEWVLPVTFRLKDPAPEIIKINLHGYLPGGRKLAYLGGGLGDIGPLPLKQSACRLINLADGLPVWEGETRLSRWDDGASGERVFHLDFSEFSTPGRYVLEVDDIGRSLPFTIGDSAFAPAVASLVDTLHRQRCGTCHDAAANLAKFYDVGDDMLHLLPDRLDPAGRTIDVRGGWHSPDRMNDRILSQQVETVGYLLAAFEANREWFSRSKYPQAYHDNDSLDLPDILHEAKWGLDWLERMYDPTDGGSYFRVVSDGSQVFCMAKHPYYATLAGVSFARAARIFEPYDHKLSNRYLYISRAALRFALSNPARAARAIPLLAAEIYVTTGNQECHDLFLQSDMRDSISYALCTRDDVDRQAQAEARQHYVSLSEATLARQRQRGYLICFAPQADGMQAATDAARLMSGFQVSGRNEFREAASLCIDYMLGANPLGRCWLEDAASWQTASRPSDKPAILKNLATMYPHADESPPLRHAARQRLHSGSAGTLAHPEAIVIYAFSLFMPGSAR